jgi:hypothetical protein
MEGFWACCFGYDLKTVAIYWSLLASEGDRVLVVHPMHE